MVGLKADTSPGVEVPPPPPPHEVVIINIRILMNGFDFTLNYKFKK